MSDIGWKRLSTVLGWIFQQLLEKLKPFPSFALSPNLFYWCHQITEVTVRMLSKCPSLGFGSLGLGPNFGQCSWGLPSFPSGDLRKRLSDISGLAWVTAPAVLQPCLWLAVNPTDPHPNTNPNWLSGLNLDLPHHHEFVWWPTAEPVYCPWACLACLT